MCPIFMDLTPDDEPPTVPAGTVVTISEAHYMFRLQPRPRLSALRLRVDRRVVLSPDSLEWVRVVGAHLPPDGADPVPVDVLVRVTALQRALAQAAIAQEPHGQSSQAGRGEEST
jgi:hypothetical protein